MMAKRKWKLLFIMPMLALVMAISGLLPHANAAGEESKLPSIRIAVSVPQVQVGETFEAAVWLQGFTGDYADIQGYEVHIEYDPALLEPVIEGTDGEGAALQPNVFQAGASPMTLVNRIDATLGQIQISQISTKKGSQLFAGYGKIGTVAFKALAPGNAKLTQSKSIVIKADNPGMNIIHTFNAPVIEILSPGSAGTGGSDTTLQLGEQPAKPGTSVTLEQALQAFGDYDAIKKMAWAADAIGGFARKKVLQGNASAFFEPRRNITRAEFAKSAVVALGLDMRQQKSPTFADVPKTAWHYDYVETAYQYGLVQGTESGGVRAFRPNDPITRAELSAIMARVVRELGEYSAAPTVQLPFADVQSGYWAEEDIRLLYELKLAEGRGENSYDANGNASRAETAVLLERLLAYLSA